MKKEVCTEDYQVQLPFPTEPRYPDMVKITSDQIGQAHHNYLIAKNQYDKDYRAYWEEWNAVALRFKKALLDELGISNHPKADLLWDMMWEKYNSHSDGDLDAIYDEMYYLAPLLQD